MARSSRAVVASLALVAALAACNTVLGLGDYEEVQCARDCGVPDVASESTPDAADSSPFGGEAGSYDPKRAWASWPMPNPANDAGYPNEASYSADGGTVVDNVTKLEWELSTSAAQIDATMVVAYCAGRTTGGYTDWRVPTRIELVTLIDYFASPAIDPAFAGTKTDPYMTASPVFDAGTNYTVDFGTGSVQTVRRSSAWVRCVRGPR